MVSSPYWVPLLDASQRWRIELSLLPWASLLVLFCAWWARPNHHISILGSAIATALILFEVLMPGYFYFFLLRSRVVNPLIEPDPSWRLAMVVTKAPAEPWPLVRSTLEAMLAQDLVHDTWLADEAPSDETLQWCRSHGVQVSTRQGVAAYHRATWPRRTRCKEGNLAFFYDHYGYERYDIVAQLDADHVPAPDYLRQIIKPFVDPVVGYVAAPSICDRNAERSWMARGRLYAEATLHGPLQCGYNDGWAPLCIGSHYCVRTSALKAIGGLGPELAEDHSTTLMMNASGWSGVFQPDAIAHGDGPETFLDGMLQEFQWSRSLMMILLQLTPQCLTSLSARKACQFLFSQVWYALFSSAAIIGFSIPILCLAFNKPMLRIEYLPFVGFAGFLSLSNLLPAAVLKRQGILRPANVPIISWENPLFTLARIPFVFAGILNGVLSVLLSRQLDFRVTPKGDRREVRLPFRALLPYALVSIFSSLAVIGLAHRSAARGYYFLALFTALLLAVVIGVIVALHHQESGWQQRSSLVKGSLLFVAALSLAITGFALRLGQTVPEILGPLRTLAVAKGLLEPLSQGTCRFRPCFGYYDHDGTLNRQAVPSDLAHHFIPWGPRYADRLRTVLDDDRAKGVQSLITLEPWPWAVMELGDPHTYKQRERQANRALLVGISTGRHDRDLLASLRVIAGSGDRPVLVRLMHEMEIAGQYPWSPADARAFIAAYRHVVALARRHDLLSLRWVWSPAGFQRAARFWPGADVVDVVGLSLYATPEWNSGLVPKGRNLSLDRLLKARYWVRRYAKPILLAEVGINAPAAEKRAWFRQALHDLPYFPEVVGWVYFNQRQPPIVPLPIGLPNWGLSLEEAADLRQALEQTSP
ncbi:MAG: glycosyltransferase family 2 protein [Synechococcaceae cyanobacterium]|nr:glycosyltransferase family 2 protein [Synechococcaceae cyanobacterium]